MSGSVFCDDAPVSFGKIRFVPENGPAWSATIQDGKYTTAGTKGVPVGELRIEIQAFHTPGDGAASPEDDILPMEQYLPAKYNSRSELRMTIEPGTRSVVEDFHLSTK